jgi:hypothetical protein
MRELAQRKLLLEEQNRTVRETDAAHHHRART